MKFYDETKPFYLDMEASGIGLGATLLQLRDGMTCSKDAASDNTILRPTVFSSKSLTSAEQRYSNIKRKALGILHGLKKIHHYCFAMEVSIITNHKPLVAIFKKDVATLLQQIQCILLWIHQYWVRIIYKLGPELFHCGLAVQAQSHEEQRWRDTWHGHKGGCNTDVNKHPRMLNKTGSAETK